MRRMRRDRYSHPASLFQQNASVSAFAQKSSVRVPRLHLCRRPGFRLQIGFLRLILERSKMFSLCQGARRSQPEARMSMEMLFGRERPAEKSALSFGCS